MISEKILVNPENKKIEDTITLTYDQRFIRRKKLVSDNNFGFLVNLSETVSLKKNDGFLLDNGSIILIKSAKEELLEIKSNNLMKITWHIGNRHIPCQIENERLLIQVDKEIENLIKENLKDIALQIYELNHDDKKSLLSEYKEWILNKLDLEEVMMLPYEAYTNKLDSNYLDDSL